MRHVLAVTTVLVLVAAPFDDQRGAAQADDDMALQRCIWACLANSAGNDDPRYHQCVQRVCLDGAEQAAPQAATPAPVAASRETVAFVQRTLASLGFDPGPADGIAGPRTAAAIADFRRARGLAGSGIDTALLEALRTGR